MKTTALKPAKSKTPALDSLKPILERRCPRIVNKHFKPFIDGVKAS